MSSLKALTKQHNKIHFSSIENSNHPINTSYFSNTKRFLFSEETNINFLMCKCIALEDINLEADLTINTSQECPISKTEINNYIYDYKNKIKRTFNKQSKLLLSTIPEFQLE